MIITSLRLTDFGIFYGTQTIAPLTPGLYVIHGHNGRGKTTLINAVRWCLYGRYFDRQDRPVPPEVTLNRQARREGRSEFVVEMAMRDGTDEYLLRRHQFVSAAGQTGSQQYIERNGRPLTAGERDRAVAAILSEQVSRFFLFDGEQLQRYESLLLQDAGSQLIKQGIEQILGLPVLDNALGDLAVVVEDLNKRLAREARRTQQLEQVAVRAEQAQADLEAKDRDIQDLEQQRSEQQRIIAEKDAFLQKYENELEQVKKLETLDEKITDLGVNKTHLEELLADHLREGWRDVLAAAVQPRVRELREAVLAGQKAIADDVVRRQLETSVEAHMCALCNQALDSEHVHQLTAQLAASAPVAVPKQDGADAAVLVQLLSPITNTGHIALAVGLDRDVAGLEGEILALRQEAGRLREVLENVPLGEVPNAQRERDQAQQELGRLGRALEDASRDRTEILERLQRARDEIRRSGQGPGQRSKLSRAIDLAENLRRIFATAKGRFRDDLRSAVEASAIEVFRQLTSEPEFASLRINNSYGLEILNSQGEVVTGRSAGQEQVVALALIAALNRNAQRQAPVIMDTPFGRLDPMHRANVLRFIPQLAEQVFLLVHGGEVRDEDLALIADRITERYELARVDPDRTTIAIEDAR